MEELAGIRSVEMLAARRASRNAVVFGAILTVLGVFCIMAPLFAGIAVTTLIGMLVLAAGIVELVNAFSADSFGQGAFRFAFGALWILAGAFILANPAGGLGALTMILIGLFLAAGAIELFLAFKQRPEEGWIWMLAGGIVSIALAVFLIAQWPASGIWAVGIFVGVRMLMRGWVLTALGRAGQEQLTYLQDSRIEVLEDHVRESAMALQETQAMLADQTTMLLTLGDELRQKVSSADVDPAIQDLNRELGEAREQLEGVAAATKESWNEVQTEANAAFEKLRARAGEMTKRLKGELGLDG